MHEELIVSGYKPPCVQDIRSESVLARRHSYSASRSRTQTDQLDFSHNMHTTSSQSSSSQSKHGQTDWNSSPTTKSEVQKPQSSRQSTARRIRYHSMRHTPSYVDEMLFGSQLEEPSFKPPWSEKMAKPIFKWAPDDTACRFKVTKTMVSSKRPKTATKSIWSSSQPVRAIWRP